MVDLKTQESVEETFCSSNGDVALTNKRFGSMCLSGNVSAFGEGGTRVDSGMKDVEIRSRVATPKQ